MILEDIVTDFITATQTETAALFLQGDILVTAEANGFDIRQIDNHVASQAHMSRTLVYTRYITAKTFPPAKRNPELNWSLHRICATTDAPDNWLALAADEQLSTRELADAIRANGGVVEKPVYMLDKVTCAVYVNHDGTYTVVPGEGDAVVSICLAPNGVLSQTGKKGAA